MALPQLIRLRPSRLLLFASVLAHLLALLVLVPLALPPAAGFALAILVLASAAATLHRILRGPVDTLQLGAGGELVVSGKVGAGETVAVDTSTVVLPGLIVLRLRAGRRRLALPLFRDAVGPEQHRQLRLWLRWQAASR